MSRPLGTQVLCLSWWEAGGGLPPVSVPPCFPDPSHPARCRKAHPPPAFAGVLFLASNSEKWGLPQMTTSEAGPVLERNPEFWAPFFAETSTRCP